MDRVFSSREFMITLARKRVAMKRPARWEKSSRKWRWKRTGESSTLDWIQIVGTFDKKSNNGAWTKLHELGFVSILSSSIVDTTEVHAYNEGFILVSCIATIRAFLTTFLTPIYYMKIDTNVPMTPTVTPTIMRPVAKPTSGLFAVMSVFFSTARNMTVGKTNTMRIPNNPPAKALTMPKSETTAATIVIMVSKMTVNTSTLRLSFC